MPLAAASALASDLQIVPRDTAAEEAALERIAAWAIQFTPAVSIAQPAEVLLEIEGSLTLFGGLKDLWNEVAEGLARARLCRVDRVRADAARARSGSRARASRCGCGIAMRCGRAFPICRSKSCTRRPMRSRCCRTSARRTRAATASRCRATVSRGGSDRAFSTISTARSGICPIRALFSRRRPSSRPRSRCPRRRRKPRCCSSRRAGCSSSSAVISRRPRTARSASRFTFEHHKREPTRLTLSLVAATRDADHLTNVLRERLERTALPCPATAIALESELLLPLASRNLSLLPDAGQQEEAAAQLIERLRARLGDEAVLGLKRFRRSPARARVAHVSAGSPMAAATSALPRAAIAAGPAAVAPGASRGRSSEIADAPCYDGRLTLARRPRAHRIGLVGRPRRHARLLRRVQSVGSAAVDLPRAQRARRGGFCTGFLPESR